ncbi:MAG: hypothetical protein Kow0042_12570 [Calditrichia bacterium]
MFNRLAKHRKFDYTPLYYNPAKDEREGHPQIKFSQLRRRRKSHSFIWLFGLLLFVVYLLIALSKIVQNY